MYPRILELPQNSSFFLLGSKACGKSGLLEHHFNKSIIIDLTNKDLSHRLSAWPNDLLKIIEEKNAGQNWIIIKEIQKVPALLGPIQSLIKQNLFKFALTCSNTRKLKRIDAHTAVAPKSVLKLFPLTSQEIDTGFELERALSFGTLPEVIGLKTDAEKQNRLKTIVQKYLQEEIIEEQTLRNLPPFRRFLECVGRTTSNSLHYSNIARDIDSDAKTIQRYYAILEETLLGFHVPSFNPSIRKQQKKAKKFYFFDTGIARALSGRPISMLVPQTAEYEQMFENFVVNEIYRLLAYSKKPFHLSHIQISDKQKIELVITIASEAPILCTITSATRIDERDTKNLSTLGKDFPKSRKLLLSQSPASQHFGSINALYWQDAFKEICGQTKCPLNVEKDISLQAMSFTKHMAAKVKPSPASQPTTLQKTKSSSAQSWCLWSDNQA